MDRFEGRNVIVTGAGSGFGAEVSRRFGEVHHAIQGAFRAHTPYLLLVELDSQRGQPGEHDDIRMTSKLATPDGDLAPPEMIKEVGIGTRLNIVYTDISDEVSIPLFTVDDDANQPDQPWRYAIE